MHSFSISTWIRLALSEIMFKKESLTKFLSELDRTESNLKVYELDIGQQGEGMNATWSFRGVMTIHEGMFLIAGTIETNDNISFDPTPDRLRELMIANVEQYILSQVEQK